MDSLLTLIKTGLKRLPLLAIPLVFWGKILSGFYTYRDLIQRFSLPANEMFYFMDYAGSGDTYLCCSILKALHAIQDDAVFITAGSASAKIATLSGFRQVHSLATQTAFHVRCLMRFYGKRLYLAPLLYESEPLIYSGILRHMQGYRGLDFMTLLKVGISSALSFPYSQISFTPICFDGDNGDEVVEQMFAEHHLKKGRTLLVAPYAGRHNMMGIPTSYYEKIVASYRNAGFTVCTNIDPQGLEREIRGSIPLNIPYQFVQAFCAAGGHFLGIRSGLCDIVAAVQQCRMVVLYPDGPLGEGPGTWTEFFSLSQMGMSNQCKEIVIEKASLSQESGQ